MTCELCCLYSYADSFLFMGTVSCKDYEAVHASTMASIP